MDADLGNIFMDEKYANMTMENHHMTAAFKKMNHDMNGIRPLWYQEESRRRFANDKYWNTDFGKFNETTPSPNHNIGNWHFFKTHIHDSRLKTHHNTISRRRRAWADITGELPEWHEYYYSQWHLLTPYA
jgi:hypothetical protein